MPQMQIIMFSKEVSLINCMIGYIKKQNKVYYFNGQMPLFSHDEKDQDSFKMFMAQLYVTGNAKQSEINKTFGLNPINMKRWVKKYQEGGPGAFYRKEIKSTKRVMTKEVLKKAQELIDKEYTNKDIAEELSLKVDTLRRSIRIGELHRGEVKKKSSV